MKKPFGVSRHLTFLILTFALGTLLRVCLPGKVPFGLNHDEASIGYDAFTLAKYGIDRNGYPWPIYPITWGSGGGSPLMVYLSVISTKIFGKSVASLRFFPMLLGVLTLITLGLMPFTQTNASRAQKERLSLLLMFICAVNPWHIMLCRWALDCNTLPFFLAIALLSFLWAAESPKGRLVKYMLSAALFALCPYSYGSATIVIPIALIFIGLYAIKRGQMSVKELLLSALSFSLVILPLALFLGINALGLRAIVTEHFSIPLFTANRSVFSFDDGGVPHRVMENLIYLFKFFTIGVESDEVRANYVPGFAQMYRFTFPLTWIGIGVSFKDLIQEKRAKDEASGLSLMDVCVLIITGATVLFSLFISLDINRMTLLLLPLIYFQGRGLCAISLRTTYVSPIICSCLLCGLSLFARDYFGSSYRDFSQDSFMPGYLEAVDEAARIAGDGRQVLSTYTNVTAPFIIALYASETPPDVFLNSVQWKDETAEFRIASSFRGFTFGLPDDLSQIDMSRTVVILHLSELHDFPGIELYDRSFHGHFVTIFT